MRVGPENAELAVTGRLHERSGRRRQSGDGIKVVIGRGKEVPKASEADAILWDSQVGAHRELDLGDDAVHPARR